MSAAPSLAWKFARAVSARSHVRVAIADAAGNYQNSYPSLAALDGDEPDGPFAVQLGSRTGQSFALLGFDLDSGRGDVDRDLEILLDLLNSTGISYLVAESGPTGGRHVWVRPAAPAPAGLIKQLAHGLRYLLPTLDITPLTNPSTGALRPPGAPHRSGGRSRLLTSDLTSFLAAAASAPQLQTLTEIVAAALPAISRDATVRAIAHDSKGHPYLPGPKRPLPPGSQQALQQTVEAGDDASTVLWSILLGAVRSHWTLADIEALSSSPGLEHLRTESAKTGARRIPRSRAVQAEVLRYQWSRAVAYIEATGPTSTQTNGDFIERAVEIAAGIEAAQQRADAAPGRWSQAGGATDRLVFDALCVLHLQSVAPAVEADQRRLAMICGLGRETVRRALERLAGDAWIAQTAPAAGPKAAAWAVGMPHTKVQPDSGSDTLSTDPQLPRAQADTRPAPGALTLRTDLLDRLQTRIALQAHDVFSSEGLGHDAGAIWAQLDQGTDLFDLAAATGYSQPQINQYVHDLHEAGLWHWDPDQGTATTDSNDRDTAALLLGVAGKLADRQHRYRIERELWAWWLEHLDWLKTSGKQKRRILTQAWKERQQRWLERQGAAQLTIAVPGLTRTQRLGPYPRRDGRADHVTARAMIAAAEAAAATVASTAALAA